MSLAGMGGQQTGKQAARPAIRLSAQPVSCSLQQEHRMTNTLLQRTAMGAVDSPYPSIGAPPTSVMTCAVTPTIIGAASEIRRVPLMLIWAVDCPSRSTLERWISAMLCIAPSSGDLAPCQCLGAGRDRRASHVLIGYLLDVEPDIRAPLVAAGY